METLVVDNAGQSTIKVSVDKYQKKVPKLTVKNGAVVIDESNELQKKWFKRFKE